MGGWKDGSEIPTFNTKTVCDGIFTTISQQLDCFNVSVMSVMNDGTRLRLEFIVRNGLHKLTFESWVERKMVPIDPTFQHQDAVCDGIFATISQ